MTEMKLVSRTELTEKELEDALETCAREPIHIPNRIQPHGCLIVASANTDEIVQVSKNAEVFIGIPFKDLIGQKLEKILGKRDLNRINEIARKYELQPLKSASVIISDREYDAVVHYMDDFKIVELEIFEEKNNINDHRIYEDLRDFAIVFQKASDLESLYSVIIDEVRKLTGFGRVKLYKFDEDWNGMVVAESRDKRMPSYLGLNFPASDIPEQARRLYSKSYLRLIADISYKPVDLYPEKIKGADKPLDMTYSVLRSVSPVHIQYLDNINVKASMSISIMQGGELWGLVACHHDKPHHVPYRSRVLAEILGHIFSAKLSSMEQAEKEKRAAQKSLLIEKISSQLNGAVKANDILFGYNDIALQALVSDGMIIHTNKNLNCFGMTPKGKQLEKFLEWCKESLEKKVVYTRDTKSFFVEKGLDFDIDGGFLAMPIGIKSNDFAVWFRTAKTNKVNWAGDPEKPVEKTKAGYRLTPRSSFELWQTETKGICAPWGDSDIEAAHSITNIILEHEKIYAERANDAKTEFLSHMSHELRTPLGAVTGIIQLLNNDEDLNERQKKLVKTLSVSSRSLMSLLNDLLDVAKIESGEVQMEDNRFTLSDLLEDLRSMMMVKANEKDLKLNVNYDRDDHRILCGDVSRIRQILINLVNNALKFTEQGFVNILARFENHNDTEWTVFEVIDSGVGISEDQVDAIFNKFIQEDSSITRQFGGTGLGLSISKGLVEIMNGDIEVTSKKGLGSKFTVKLPLECEAGQDTPEIKDLIPDYDDMDMGAMKKKILLVEDYEGNVVVAMHFLQNMGYQVVIANNGKAALEKLEREEFDLIIMDVQMPIMDGLTATKIIKERQRTGEFKETPIIGMTANALKEDRAKCLDAGMDDYIPKPLDLKKVAGKIVTMLSEA